MGIQAREVLQGWGVPSEKIVDALNSANHYSLNAQMEAPGFSQRMDKIHSNFGKDKNLALVVGRLIPLKGIESLLSAWSKLPVATRDDWNLVLVGRGPLESVVKAHDDPSVHLAGYIPETEIASWYSAADLHVFPTRGDVWGLVVNEASICGTPTLCSVHAGCYDDLITEDENGLSIDFTHPEASKCLNNALQHPELEKLGEAAKHHIARFRLDGMADRFHEAVEGSSVAVMQPAVGL
jgi:glycosyltransferase involved in cell wall biosynthesis